MHETAHLPIFQYLDICNFAMHCELILHDIFATEEENVQKNETLIL